MAWLQLKAYLPGKGIIDVLNAPPLSQAATLLDKKDDEWGNGVFKIGGAILLPFANRIRGKLNPGGKTITANVAGNMLTLPANWHGNKPGAEVHSIHGLMQRSKFQDIKRTSKADAISVSAVLHAGNFDGHWLSDTDVTVESTLKNNAVELEVTAKNVGKTPLPMGVGWHPYFVIPSGDRKQALLHIPSDTRAVMNNYDDTFTTGQRVPVRGTPVRLQRARRPRSRRSVSGRQLLGAGAPARWQHRLGNHRPEIALWTAAHDSVVRHSHPSGIRAASEELCRHRTAVQLS